jgi:hypothetical protein
MNEIKQNNHRVCPLIHFGVARMGLQKDKLMLGVRQETCGKNSHSLVHI